ncbi:MAG: FHA domain-containing protein [Anaerolineae bacterium]|jgi:pSer/pThr/pTyr-binding forkhead associated (FHA) protein|nr:FHA domain-containing protein [Anaerolineae bacterium]
MSDANYKISLHFPKQQILTLRIERLTVFGRNEYGVIDLTPYGAEALGVSRRHASMIPTHDKLVISDLGSTNGTTLNGASLKPNQFYTLRPNDILYFGRLEARVNFMITKTLRATEKSTEPFEEKLQQPPYTLPMSQQTIEQSQVNTTNHESNPLIQRAAINMDDPDVQAAIRILQTVVINKDMTPYMFNYIAAQSVENTAWQYNKRLAVLRTACSFGYVARDNAELMQEERRKNHQRFGNIE